MKQKTISFAASVELIEKVGELAKKIGEKNKSKLYRQLLEDGLSGRGLEADLRRIMRTAVRSNLAVNTLADMLLKDPKLYSAYLDKVKEKEDSTWTKKKKK